MDTIEVESDTDIDKSSESSLESDMLINAPDDEDESQKKTSPPPTTTPKPVLKRDSSIRKALDFSKDNKGSNIGLLKYFGQGTKEDIEEYWKKEEERSAVNQEKEDFKKKSVDMEKRLHKRELARVRQQRKRDKIKEREVKEGVRSPGGKKRKVNLKISIKTKLIIILGC